MKPANIKITEKETRSWAGVNLRAVDDENDDEVFAIEGVAAAYNVRSAPIAGQFVEQIAPGAFTDSLRDMDQVACFNHDPNQVLGRKTAGTLVLQDSKAGLKFRCTLDRDNPVHQTVHSYIKRKEVTGCSFSFSVPEGGDTWVDSNGTVLRTLVRVKLHELGPVLWPAYGTTSVGARAEARSNYTLLDTGTDSAWRERTLARLAKIHADMDRE